MKVVLERMAFAQEFRGKQNVQVRMELVDAIGVVNRICGLDYDDWIRSELLYFI